MENDTARNDGSGVIGWIIQYRVHGSRYHLALIEAIEAQESLNRELRRLPPERIRTGIAPKQARTRKKQRLTRLKRRQKRQKCIR